MLRHLVLPLRRFRCSPSNRNRGASVHRRASRRKARSRSNTLPAERKSRSVQLTLRMDCGRIKAQAARLCTLKGPSPLQRFRALCFSNARNLVDVCQVIRLSSDKTGLSEFDCRSSKLRRQLPRLIHNVDGTTFASLYAVRPTNSLHLR